MEDQKPTPRPSRRERREARRQMHVVRDEPTAVGRILRGIPRAVGSTAHAVVRGMVDGFPVLSGVVNTVAPERPRTRYESGVRIFSGTVTVALVAVFVLLKWTGDITAAQLVRLLIALLVG